MAADLTAQALDHLPGEVLVGVGQDQHELVAGQPGSQIVLAQHMAQQPRHRAQHLVADHM